MAFETLLSLLAVSAVHAKPDAGRTNSEGQNRRESKAQQRRQGRDASHPVPNTQGQMTGKLIDTTA